jgi:hypothetical protein
MIYKRFHKEGPGELPMIDYATNEDELRTLTDEETAAIVHAKKAAKETEEAILAAQQKAAESEGQLEAVLESKQDAHARVAAANAAGAAIETVNFKGVDELELMKTIRKVNDNAEAEAARVAAVAERKAGDLRLMRGDEVDYSIVNERRLAGIPDEVIEVETPEWLKDDPEFAVTEDPAAMRLVETKGELNKSIEGQRRVEAKRVSGVTYVEASVPLGSEYEDIPPLPPQELSAEGLAEQEHVKQVLGPDNAPKRTSVPKVEPSGLLARIKGWFGGK